MSAGAFTDPCDDPRTPARKRKLEAENTVNVASQDAELDFDQSQENISGSEPAVGAGKARFLKKARRSTPCSMPPFSAC